MHLHSVLHLTFLQNIYLYFHIQKGYRRVFRGKLPIFLQIRNHGLISNFKLKFYRLEGGLRELAKQYYANRIKKVKTLKDKATQTPLLVRYNFKIAYFQEIRRDFIAALRYGNG